MGQRGIVWSLQGEFDKALSDLNQLLLLDPHSVLGYIEHGSAWHQKEEPDKAIAGASEALIIDPKSVAAYNRLSLAWLFKGDHDKAMEYALMAIEIDAAFPGAYNSRANAWVEKDDYNQAITDYNEALKLKPDDAQVMSNRGRALRKIGEYDKALADYKEALRLDPKNISAITWLAWLQATCPDHKYRDDKQALSNASRVYQLSAGKDWSAIDTLAAAYADKGDFKLAREWAAKALEMAKTDKDKADVRNHLKFFEQGKPFREELLKASK